MTASRILITTFMLAQDMPFRRVASLAGKNYSDAVALAGGLPFMVSNLSPALAEAYCECADGVLFSGGGDVEPRLYGEQPHPRLGEVEHERDRFELALYRAARARGLPILGICRGIQLINVAEGGTLHQDLPSLPGTISHSQARRDSSLGHEVTLEPKSYLAEALGKASLWTNSFHHQAVDRLGQGLKITGRAQDDTVEVLENDGGSFVLGVQWHPEMSFRDHPEHFVPFRLFLEAVKARRERAPWQPSRSAVHLGE
jgi:putative glutamine amidotransferase